jgi:hypothetical protein
MAEFMASSYKQTNPKFNSPPVPKTQGSELRVIVKAILATSDSYTEGTDA